MHIFANRPDFWMSIVGILIMIGMAGYFVWFFMRNMREDARRELERQREAERRG